MGKTLCFEIDFRMAEEGHAELGSSEAKPKSFHKKQYDRMEYEVLS